MVREYEDSMPPRLLLIVDPWLPKKPKEADRDRLESLLSLAAGICREWRRGAARGWHWQSAAEIRSRSTARLGRLPPSGSY